MNDSSYVGATASDRKLPHAYVRKYNVDSYDTNSLYEFVCFQNSGMVQWVSFHCMKPSWITFHEMVSYNRLWNFIRPIIGFWKRGKITGRFTDFAVMKLSDWVLILGKKFPCFHWMPSVQSCYRKPGSPIWMMIWKPTSVIFRRVWEIKIWDTLSCVFVPTRGDNPTSFPR